MSDYEVKKWSVVTWLRAQLDEDERVARAVAGSGRWVKYSEGGDGAAIETEPGGDPGAPARVLAEVEAKRRILELYEWAVARQALDPGDRLHLGERAVAEQVLWHLAEPYADRPGYDESWRP